MITSLLNSKNFLEKYQKQIRKLALKRKPRYTRSNPDPDPPAVFDNPDLIPKILRKQEEQELLVDSSPQEVQQSYIPTPTKPSVCPHIAPSSPSSSSTSQSTFSTPPSTTHIYTTVTVVSAIPFLPVVPFVPVNMENRYAPLLLPANPGAMPQDYQSKITYFDGTGTYIAQHHTKKMQDYFETMKLTMMM